MVVLFLFISVVLFVLADLGLRTATQRLRQKKLREEDGSAAIVKVGPPRASAKHRVRVE